MPQTWKTVRVFISSTFRDMHAERDHLVRFVFPKLREELLKRRIHLVDVDLRWGVTSEQDAFQVCSKIIDECKPRFLCMLGGRYGWTPPGQYQSITAAEVQHVIERLGEHRYSYFYFRDPKVTASIPEQAAKDGGYREFPQPDEIAQVGSEEAQRRARERAEKLNALKRDIADKGLKPFTYRSGWDDRQKRVIGLGEFGDRVYADLMASINDELGAGAPAEVDEFTEEREAMDAFAEERTERYMIGSRQAILDEMSRFAQSDGAPNILLITGTPGSGKSALLAQFCKSQSAILDSQSSILISHFVGASAGSTDLRRTLRRFCLTIRNQYGQVFEQEKTSRLAAVTGQDEEATKKRQAIEKEYEVPQETNMLVPTLGRWLGTIPVDQRVVIVIDALNQFAPPTTPTTCNGYRAICRRMYG